MRVNATAMIDDPEVKASARATPASVFWRRFSLGLGVILLIVGAGGHLFHSRIYAWMLSAIQVWVWPNQSPSLYGLSDLHLLIAVVLWTCALTGMLIVAMATPYGRAIVLNTLTNDFGDTTKRNAVTACVLSIALTAVGVALILSYKLSGVLGIREWYGEDGFFEYMFVVVLLIATVLLFVAGLTERVRRRGIHPRPTSLQSWFAMGVGCVLFLIAMEEISWGQRLFHWKAGGLFEQFNLQAETNVHNFVSPAVLGPILQTITSLIVLLTLLKLALSLKRRSHPAWTLLLPTVLILPVAVLTVLLSFSPIRVSDELIEELLALMAFCYSIQLFLMLNRPRLTIGDHKADLTGVGTVDHTDQSSKDTACAEYVE
jgi:hypothetical protein